MADVEEAMAGVPQSVHEMKASEVPDRESTHRPGGITRHSRSLSSDRRGHVTRAQSSSSPSRKSEWKTYSKEYPQKRSDVTISDYSKEEGSKRKKWEKEKRALRERQAKLQQERAEAEAAKQREVQEKQVLEYKARVQARVDKQQDKIRRAAEERHRREKAYQELLSKTREKGLLFERLQEAGASKVHAIEQEKQSDYVNTLGRMRKLGAQDIATRPDLHPSLRVMQRRRQEEILQREAVKEPPAFTPKAAESPVAGSPVSSFMTTRRMPGASLAGGFATGAAATSGHGPAKPARKRRPARKPPAPRAAVIERASSPLAIPGVEILVDGVPYEAPAPPPATHTSGISPTRTSSTVQRSTSRQESVAAAAPDRLAQSPSAASGSFRRPSAAESAAEGAAVEPANANVPLDALAAVPLTAEQQDQNGANEAAVVSGSAVEATADAEATPGTLAESEAAAEAASEHAADGSDGAGTGRAGVGSDGGKAASAAGEADAASDAGSGDDYDDDGDDAEESGDDKSDTGATSNKGAA